MTLRIRIYWQISRLMTSMAFVLVSLLTVRLVVVASTINVNSTVTGNYSCNFDGTLCNWSHDLSLPINWTMLSGSTPSLHTGPVSDVSGSGSYLYIEARNRQYGSVAGLISPILQGVHCMTFMYHMHGTSVGSIIVYIKTAEYQQPVWIKTWSQRNQWLKAHIQLDELTSNYQVLIHGIVGQSWSSDCAIDEVSFTDGLCNEISTRWLHVYFTEDGDKFKVAAQSGVAMETWDYQFSFLAHQTKVHENATMYLVYPPECSPNALSTNFSIKPYCYPFDFFYASSANRGDNQSTILLLNQDNDQYKGLKVENMNNLCCGEEVHGFFYARVSFQDISLCSPGWSAVGNTCIHFTTSTRSGFDAMNYCSKKGGSLITLSTMKKFLSITGYMNQFRYGSSRYSYSVGVAPAEDTYRWLWVNKTLVSEEIVSIIRNQHRSKNCGSLKRTDGIWELAAVKCTSRLYFICSKREDDSKQCDDGWIKINSTCYKLSMYNAIYIGVKRYCERLGHSTSPAIIDSKDTVQILGRNLSESLQGLGFIHDVALYIGIRYLPETRWNDGIEIDKRIWSQGYPKIMETDVLQCGGLVFGLDGWRIKQRHCGQREKTICEMQKTNHAYRRPTFSNSPSEYGHQSFAVDGNYASCYQTKPTQNPWLKITLAREMFVAKIDITQRKSCCLKTDTSFRVSLDNSPTTLCSKYYNVYLRDATVFVCSQEFKTLHVTIAMDGENKRLTLCEVTITAFDDHVGLQGVLDKLWTDFSYPSLKRLREDIRVPSHPESVTTFKDFDAPYHISRVYGKQMLTYLQVPVSGDYTFTIACTSECDLWIHSGDIKQHKYIIQRLIAKLDNLYRVDHNEWNRYPNHQNSKPVTLSQCSFYKMQMMFITILGGFASTAMKFPNGSFEGPIRQSRLYWTHPGYQTIDISLNNNQTTITTEASEDPLSIQVTYKHCCRGAQCPGCSARVLLDVNYTSLVVNDSLGIDCIQYTTSIKLSILVQTGKYPITMKYTFNGDVPATITERFLGYLIVKPKSIFKCDFSKDTCGLKNGNGTKDSQWNIINSNQGQYLTSSHHTAWLETDWIQSDSLMNSVGVCLKFDFYSTGESSLKVVLFTPTSEQGQVVWSVPGYQGGRWVKGQVSWNKLKTFKIVLIGKGKVKNSIDLDSILLVASECSNRPQHSVPGYKCDDNIAFQCFNGQCIDKQLVCDGDAMCIDGSDEKNCTCISNTFPCPNGACLKTSQICDQKNDCGVEGYDEKNCGSKCPRDYFQCVSGDCVPMSVTCDGQQDCIDGTDEPSLCGSDYCPLNNVSCRAIDETLFNQKCANWKVHCNFDHGSLCGMVQESSLEWRLHSGPTPTRNTGPSYDHTTLDNKGSYLYLEASDREPGEKAILSSEFLLGGRPVCVGFWYHMYGVHIGSLRVYYKTNQTQMLLWQRDGHVSDDWLFGQTSFNTTDSFKILIEGTTGSGAYGDIAIDDVTISYDHCQTIHSQVNPSCYFDRDLCQWTASEGWLLSHGGIRPMQLDWKGTLGEYIYIYRRSTSNEQMTSPLVPSTLRCVRFWYYLSNIKIYGSEISVHMICGHVKKRLWRNAAELSAWQYVQIPLTCSSDFLVNIEAKRAELLSRIVLDDITFNTDPCSQIPRPVFTVENATQSHGAVRHWRLDGSDQDLRTFGTMPFYEDSGHKVAYFDGISGWFQSPAVDFSITSFSVVVWINVRDNERTNAIYSDWNSPHFQFRFDVQTRRLCIELRGEIRSFLGNFCCSISSKEWTMIGFTWSPVIHRAALYKNGRIVKNYLIKCYLDCELKNTPHAFYNIGHMASRDIKYHGCMRDLMVFYRYLNQLDMMSLYNPSRMSCLIRQTTDGNCCVFPFVYLKRLHHTCQISRVAGKSWCSTTADYDKDRKWSFCRVDDDCRSVQDGWCGWKDLSGKGWIRGKAKDMRALTMTVDRVTNGVTNSSGLAFKESEVRFLEGHSDYINYTGIKGMASFTICMWAQTSDTKNPGTVFVYRTKNRNTGADKDCIYMSGNKMIQFLIYYRPLSTTLRYDDGLWHHICLRFDIRKSHFSVHIDQQLKMLNKFRRVPHSVFTGKCNEYSYSSVEASFPDASAFEVGFNLKNL